MPELRKILLVDDDEITNFINVNVLISLNLAEDVKTFLDGSEALEYIFENSNKQKPLPELVLFDYHMPLMDGMEFFHALCAKFPNICNEVVFVLLGTTLRQREIDAFKNLGVQEFIHKPLSPDAVLDLYTKHFKSKASAVKNT